MNFGLKLSTLHRCAACLAATLIMAPLLAACGGGSGSGTVPTGNIVLRDQNNYTATSTLTIPQVVTASGADLSICWSTLSTDLLGHPVLPTTDINNVSFLQILNFTEQQVADALGAGQPFTSHVKNYRDFHTTTASTCTTLSTFTLGKSLPVTPATDYVEAADKKYMLIFSNGTTPGSGSRTMIFLEPSANSAVTSVTAPEGLGILDFQADITTPAAVSAPAVGPWVVDWSLLTRDGLGNDMVFQNIDGLMVGWYDMTLAALQAQVLNYDRIATALYRLSLIHI